MQIRPPVVALLCLVGALVLHWLTPALRYSFFGQQVVGVVVALAGVSMAVWAVRLFFARATTVEPFGTPAALVTSGPYRFSRNPMYLSLLLILLGTALFARSVALLLAPAAFFGVMNAQQIPMEEARLTALFGDAYAAYRGRVRRWV